MMAKKEKKGERERDTRRKEGNILSILFVFYTPTHSLDSCSLVLIIITIIIITIIMLAFPSSPSFVPVCNFVQLTPIHLLMFKRKSNT